MELYDEYKKNIEGYTDIGWTSDADDSYWFEGFEDIWKIEEALFSDGYFAQYDIHSIDLHSILKEAIPITFSTIDMSILMEDAGEWGIRIDKTNYNIDAHEISIVINHFPGVIIEKEVITRHLDSDFYQYLLVAEELELSFKNWLKLILNKINEANKNIVN